MTPLAVVMAGWPLPRHHILSLAWLAVGFGLVTALMGLFQLNPAGDNFVLYPARAPGAVLLGGIYIAAPERITETLERVEAKDDPRRVIWEDGDFAARRYWPAGAAGVNRRRRQSSKPRPRAAAARACG